MDTRSLPGPATSPGYLYKQQRGCASARWLDFELPTSEKTSWWRIDGYETMKEDDGNGESDEESDEEAAEMELDDLLG